VVLKRCLGELEQTVGVAGVRLQDAAGQAARVQAPGRDGAVDA